MSKSRIAPRKLIAQNAFVLGMSVSAVGLTWCSHAHAGAVPIFPAGQVGVFNESSGLAGAPSYITSLPFTVNTPQLTFHQLATDGGYANASAGIANSQSTTSTKIIIGSGTGISQTHNNEGGSPSSLEVSFTAEWTIPTGGFGAPLGSNFSLPIGAKVGAFGSASVSVLLNWDYIAGSSEFPLDSYQASKSFPGTSVNQTILTSLTAPTVLFSPNQIPAGDILVMQGNITFTAAADDPTLIEIPTAADFGDAGVTADEVASFNSDVVPEPASLSLLAGGAGLLSLRRRRRSANR